MSGEKFEGWLTPPTDNREPAPADANDANDATYGAEGEATRRHMWRLAALYGALGIEVAACVVVGALGGHYADGWLASSPWAFFVGTALGCVAAGKALVRVVRQGRSTR